MGILPQGVAATIDHAVRVGQLLPGGVQVIPELVAKRDDVDHVGSSGLEGNAIADQHRLLEIQFGKRSADQVVLRAHRRVRRQQRMVLNGPDPASAGFLQCCGGHGWLGPYGERDPGETPAAPFQRFPRPGEPVAQVGVERDERARPVSAFCMTLFRATPVGRSTTRGLGTCGGARPASANRDGGVARQGADWRDRQDGFRLGREFRSEDGGKSVVALRRNH